VKTPLPAHLMRFRLHVWNVITVEFFFIDYCKGMEVCSERNLKLTAGSILFHARNGSGEASYGNLEIPLAFRFHTNY
jgi:hypothetical protein